MPAAPSPSDQSPAARPAPIRRRAAVVVAIAAVALLVGACGIKGSAVIEAGPVTTTPADPGTATTSPAPAASTTTTTEHSPGFTLPSIPTGDPGTTQTTRSADPPDTDPPDTDPSDPSDTRPSDDATPHGVTEGSLTDELESSAGLGHDQAACLAGAMFSQLTGPEIDQIYEADDKVDIDPALLIRFTTLFSTCLSGG